MSKNKLIWNIVLFLITIISIPIAHAQIIPSGSRLFFILINAAIVFVVLFILQSSLVPGKEGKEKTAIWVIVAIASLLVAFLYGQSGFIWQGPLGIFFNIKVLVNAAIIAAVLYFVLGLLPIGKNLGSPEGKRGFGVLIFFFAMLFAVKLGNQWIWDQATVQQLIGYLFGTQGILNPNYGLWTFLGAALLLSFFFDRYLLKEGAGGTKWVSYALAILIASSVAKAGYSIKTVVILGEIIFFIVLADALKNTTKWNWFLSFILVGWASASATYGTEYQGIFATLVGWFLSKLGFITVPGAQPAGWGWWWVIGIGLVVLLIGLPLGGAAIVGGKWGILAGIAFLVLMAFLFPVIGIGFVIFGALFLLALGWVMKRSQKKWEFGKLWERYSRLIRNKLFTKRDEIVAATGVYDKLWTKRRIPPDMLPEILRENLVIYFSLNNYLKRFYIWNVKFDQVKNARAICQQMWSWIDIHKDKDIKELEDEIFICRNGGRKLVYKGEEIDVGLFEGNREYIQFINQIAKFLSSYVQKIISGTTPNEHAEIMKEAQDLINAFSRYEAKIERSYKHLEERTHAYGDHQPIKAQKYLVFDQCNPYGWHEHQYKFIEKGTLLSDGTRANEKLEVNQYGEILIDKYQHMDRFYDPEPKHTPIKVHPTEIKAGKIKDFIPPADMMNFIINDWTGFIKNMRFGRFRPNSKSADDYIKHLSTAPGSPTLGKPQFYQEKNIAFTPGWKTNQTPAFDRRALVNTGLLAFVGRRNYYEIDEDVVKNDKTDPYPGVSTLGMGKYLPALVIRDTEDIKAANEYLKMYLQDLNIDVKSAADVIKTLGALKAEESQK